MNNSKIFFLILLALTFGLIFYFDVNSYIDLTYLKKHQSELGKLYLSNPIKFSFTYFFIYVFVTAVSIPGATALTLLGSAILGFWNALFIISFASTIGASLSFLLSRYFLRDLIKSKYGKIIENVNRNFEKNGGYYLVSLRLVPAVPFFVINLVMGITNIKLIKFYYISQLSMLLGTILYVNAGIKIGEIDSVSDIMSPQVIFSFSLLGLVPFIIKRVQTCYFSRGIV